MDKTNIRPELSVIIPAYNEEETIERAVTETLETLGRHRITSEVIVVNDGSRDRTSEVCNSLLKTNKFSFIDNKKNQGYSAAIRCGIAAAKGTYLCYLDADLQYSPEDMCGMFHHAANSHSSLVIGNPETKNYTLFKKIRSKTYNYIFIRTLFGLRVKDVNSLKIFKKDVASQFTLIGKSWMIDFELLYKFRRLGQRIDRFPITVHQRIAGQSKTNIFSLVKTVWEMLKLRYKML